MVQRLPRNFNPRSPCGERRLRLTLPLVPLRFQSTLPVWGATIVPDTPAAFVLDFNPRSPCGERREVRFAPMADWPHISIHAPRVGSDRGNIASTAPGNISIHAPRVGSDQVGYVPAARCKISIHAPRVGSDGLCLQSCAGDGPFQSTLPVWGATVPAIYGSIERTISIHAPRVGSDCSAGNL